MTRNWLEDVGEACRNGPVVRVVVVRAEGSCPRDAGADMLVWDDRTARTIGGGALELEVIARARAMLAAAAADYWVRVMLQFHLGPELNQCCGGAVTLLLERYGTAEGEVVRRLAGHVRGVRRPVASGVALTAASGTAGLARDAAGKEWFVEPVVTATTPLMLYGAGHVASALVRVLDGLPFSVTWADVAAERFPQVIPQGCVSFVAGDLSALAGGGVAGAFHLVMTHSHALDEAIVAAILRRGEFGYLGLIGSATKRARFRQRLVKAGLDKDLIEQMECPVGLAGLAGKEPQVIAVSVAADLLLRRQRSLSIAVDRDTAVD